MKVKGKLAPEQNKATQVTISVYDKVGDELKRLYHLVIIYKFDASELVSPNVDVIRVCVDIRKVNKAVIPDRYNRLLLDPDS